MHDLKDPKLWEYSIFFVMGNAGFISSTVGLSLLVAERHEDDDMNPNPKSTILNPRVLYGPSELSLLFWWLPKTPV